MNSRILSSVLGTLLISGSVQAKPYFQDAKLEEQKDVLSTTALPIDIDRVVVLGDSLSDSEGRFLQRTHGFVPTPQYNWGGRFSNGPLWIEYLTHALNLPTLNYSMSGARIELKNTLGSLPNVSWLDSWKVPSGFEQLDEFVTQESNFRPSDVLFINLGPNDYLFDASAGKVEAYVLSLTRLIEKSISLGATKIVTFKLPSGLKYMTFSAKDERGQLVDKKTFGLMIEKHNILFAASIADLQKRYPDVRLHLYSTDDNMDAVRSRPADFAIENLDAPCYTGFAVAGTDILADLGIKNVVCPNPRSHVFWDTAHPTTFMHCLSAVEVLSQMQSEGLVDNFGARAAEDRCKTID